MPRKKQNRRAVVVSGVRTPFVRAFQEFLKLDTFALGAASVRALLDRTGVPSLRSTPWSGEA